MKKYSWTLECELERKGEEKSAILLRKLCLFSGIFRVYLPPEYATRALPGIREQFLLLVNHTLSIAISPSVALPMIPSNIICK